jgi:hypothetical protein
LVVAQGLVDLTGSASWPKLEMVKSPLNAASFNARFAISLDGTMKAKSQFR